MKLWLLAHRMAFDLIVSMFIFITLMPFALFDKLRMSCCAGCSIHQLLLFRDAGHAQREASSGAFDMYASARMTGTPTERAQEMAAGSFDRGAKVRAPSPRPSSPRQDTAAPRQARMSRSGSPQP